MQILAMYVGLNKPDQDLRTREQLTSSFAECGRDIVTSISAPVVGDKVCAV